jgi:NAD-dependent deacetylase
MIDRVASWMHAAERVVVLTGAGISAESGVPVFRGTGGLWRQFRPEQLATPEAFGRQPELVWDWYLWRRALIAAVQPNAGHVAIARWQRQHPGVSLLTQNVDGLHARAGTAEAIELHGNLWRIRCAAGCGFSERDDCAAPPRTVLRCGCGVWLRPDVVWFGEALDAAAIDRAIAAVQVAEVIVVVGTSSVVYPVAALPQIARQAGARIVEVNVEDTPLTAAADAVLRGTAADVLPAIWSAP